MHMSKHETVISPSPAPPPGAAMPLADDRGFSMVELVLVMGVLGLLAILAIPTYDTVRDRVKAARATTELRDLEKSIISQCIDKGINAPTGWGQLGMAPPIDPWGRAYVLSAPFRQDVAFLNGDFDLYSKGPDGLTAQGIDAPESEDDIVRAGDGGFVGLVRTILSL